tara:strand:+ start:265 stop:414 length:150 start_codon:yes stop_codon:yes gene_type:complete
MLKKIVQRYVKKYGMIKLLMKIGDYAVSATKSKKDDEVWEEVKALLESM